MAENIEPIGTGEGGAPKVSTYELNQLTEQSQVTEVQSTNFSQMVDFALSKTLDGEFLGRGSPSERAELSSGAAGEVGAEKSGILSDVERPGAAKPGHPEEDPVAPVLSALSHLYQEMSVHHVAWNVATRMQKDISQLLRGS